MKHISLHIVFLLFFVIANAQKNFVINGSFKTKFNGNVMAGYNDRYDTIYVSNGLFNYKGYAIRPTEITLNVLWESKNQSNSFFIINGEKLKIRLDTITKYKPFVRLDVKMEFLEQGLTNLYFDSVFLSMKNRIERVTIEKSKKDLIKEFLERNKKNKLLSVIVLNEYKSLFTVSELKKLYAGYSKEIKGTSYGKNINRTLTSIETFDVIVGEKIKDFSQKNTRGKPITINSFRGKYLLIDFWASWCPPCRAENPNLIVAYNQFKTKGFEILGVSLDHIKHDWLNAIKDDKLSWMQVSDLKGDDNLISRSYKIKGIPSNILIDRDGIIIAKNLRGEEIENKLEEIFNLK